MKPVYQRRVANTLEDLSACMDECTAFLEAHDVPPGAAFAIPLSLEEMITNAIKYGYADRGAHCIDVELTLGSDHALLEISDDGQAFDPFDIPAPDTSLPMEERPIGGLGIHLVKNMMDHCEYTREEGRNIVRLTKRFDRAG